MSQATDQVPADAKSRLRTRTYGFVERMIFDVRYVLVVSYIGMMFGLVAFMYHVIQQNIQMALEIFHGHSGDVTVAILEGLDNVMIGNGVYLIIAGSYLVYVKGRLSNATFVKPSDRPPALQHLSPATLKEKMAASLVGVTSVHLVQFLIQTTPQTAHVNWYALATIVIVHLMLIVGFLGFWKAGHGAPHHGDDVTLDRPAQLDSRPFDLKEGTGHATDNGHGPAAVSSAAHHQ
jgi:uncharacterized protein (TIGR00645 family)